MSTWGVTAGCESDVSGRGDAVTIRPPNCWRDGAPARGRCDGRAGCPVRTLPPRLLGGRLMRETVPLSEGRLYYQRHRKPEQTLRKSNSTEEGGLPKTSRLAPGVSGSVRTSPFLSERHKPDSPPIGEPVARDVVRRRWTATTHDMDDLRSTNGSVSITDGSPSSEISFGRFGFPLSNRPNTKSLDDGGCLVNLVELVNLFRGCTCVSERALAHARASLHLPPDETDQIDQSNQTPSQYCDSDLVGPEIVDQIGNQTEVAR